MEMMVTSESTALMAISSDTRTGMLAPENPLKARDADPTLGLVKRPNTMKTRTGKPMVPNAPSGSRRKILVSIHVNFKRPRSIIVQFLFANGAASELEKDILKVGKNRSEIG